MCPFAVSITVSEDPKPSSPLLTAPKMFAALPATSLKFSAVTVRLKPVNAAKAPVSSAIYRESSSCLASKISAALSKMVRIWAGFVFLLKTVGYN